MENIHEAHEHAEHVQHDRSLQLPTFTMAVLAVLVAVVSLLGHRSSTEEVLLQSKATDTWAEFQAKSIRQNGARQLSAVIDALEVKDSAKAEQAKAQFEQQSERYDKEKDELEKEARKLEQEVQAEQRRADRFDLGEALLEIALVITSITLLTKRRIFWQLGLFLGFGESSAPSPPGSNSDPRHRRLLFSDCSSPASWPAPGTTPLLCPEPSGRPTGPAATCRDALAP